MFPLVLFMFKKYSYKSIYISIIIASMLIYIIFNFYIFDKNLGFQNNLYTNIFFHLHFFLFGMLMGYMKLKNISFISLPTTIIFIVGLIYFLDIKNYTDIIHDENRIILSIITLLIIGYFTFNDWLSEVPKRLQNTIEAFSNLTYSIYLLHFFVFYTLYNILGYENIYIMMIVTISLAIPLYYLYEKKFILLGKKYA
jgi:peptidoglycan/LPS O-acetylase OafA/YrhL